MFAHSTSSSTYSSAIDKHTAMSTKPCATQGERACIRGFHRDHCHKCIRGSVTCEMCSPDSCASCIFCVDGRKECDDCYGLGHVQRICQPCIKDHYRRQAPINKVKDQLVMAQTEFSKSMVSISSDIVAKTVNSKLILASTSGEFYQRRHHSEADITLRSYEASLQSAASTIVKVTSMFKRNRRSCSASSLTEGTKTYRRKWSWSSFSKVPSTSAAA